jgi:hypothetical protein
LVIFAVHVYRPYYIEVFWSLSKEMSLPSVSGL